MPKRGKSPRDAPGEVDKTNSKDAPPKNESTGSLKRKKKKEKGPIVAPVVIPDVSETSDEEEEEMEEEDEDVEIDETPAAPFGDELPPDEDDLTPPERFGLPEWNVPCSYFFQQQGAMDYESYLRLKYYEQSSQLRSNELKSGNELHLFLTLFQSRRTTSRISVCCSSIYSSSMEGFHNSI